MSSVTLPRHPAVAYLSLVSLGGRMSFARLTLVIAALSLSACVAPVAPGTRPIILDASYTRNTLEAGSVVFPKGVYQPTFQIKGGVYYEAPTVLISAGTPTRGGLFIPHDPSAKPACWFEILGPYSRFTVLREPIPYHY
jgi:hypothetical protein